MASTGDLSPSKPAAPQGRSTLSSIYVKNLDPEVSSAALLDTYKEFGKVVSARVATDAKGQSRGYGFIQYEEPSSAQVAVEQGNGLTIGGREVAVGPMIPTKEVTSAPDKFCNIYVKGLSEEITEAVLMDTFGRLGPITSSVIMREPSGSSRGFGFVNFSTSEDAARAVEEFHDVEHALGRWQVSKALRRAERDAEMRAKYEKELATQERLAAANLYVKNLDGSITDDSLRDMFTEYGEVVSSKVLRNFDASSRGVGFVQMLEPPSATNAISALNGKAVLGKILYVTLAQRRQDRAPRNQPNPYYGGGGAPFRGSPPPLGGYEPSGAAYAAPQAPGPLYWQPAPQLPTAVAYYPPPGMAPGMYYGQPAPGAYQQPGIPRLPYAYGNMPGAYAMQPQPQQQHAGPQGPAAPHQAPQGHVHQHAQGTPSSISRTPSLQSLATGGSEQVGHGYTTSTGRAQTALRPGQQGLGRESQPYGQAPPAGYFVQSYAMPSPETGHYEFGQPLAALPQGYYSYPYAESPAGYGPSGAYGHPGGSSERGRSPFRRQPPAERAGSRQTIAGTGPGFAASPAGMGRGRGAPGPRGNGFQYVQGRSPLEGIGGAPEGGVGAESAGGHYASQEQQHAAHRVASGQLAQQLGNLALRQ